MRQTRVAPAHERTAAESGLRKLLDARTSCEPSRESAPSQWLKSLAPDALEKVIEQFLLSAGAARTDGAHPQRRLSVLVTAICHRHPLLIHQSIAGGTVDGVEGLTTPAAPELDQKLDDLQE